jgi:hypothetical protein
MVPFDLLLVGTRLVTSSSRRFPAPPRPGHEKPDENLFTVAPQGVRYVAGKQTNERHLPRRLVRHQLSSPSPSSSASLSSSPASEGDERPHSPAAVVLHRPGFLGECIPVQHAEVSTLPAAI